MKKNLILMVLAGLFVIPALGQNPPKDKNWEMVFQDDFNTLNTNRWRVRNNFDHYGEEPQVYITPNVYVSNGNLVFETKKEEYHCPDDYVNPSNCARQYKTGEDYQYTSGWVQSRVTYKYGYFEIYAKLPGSSGYWPAFWLFASKKDTINNDCWYNEIDIFEIRGCDTTEVTHGVWRGFDCSEDVIPIEFPHSACNYTTDYHWYGLEWNSTKITWYIDRKAVCQIANNMDGIGIQNPMLIIMNVALRPPAWGCFSDSTTIFPNYMYVDQANVYQLKYDCDSVVPNIPDFSLFDYKVKKSITLNSSMYFGIKSTNRQPMASLRATDYIELLPGFEAQSGVELYLDINPCDNLIGGIGIDPGGGMSTDGE
ncbi:MAG: glycoside hydrolase family 16 protein [Bacteroidales bacterium]|jgi:beta-glucanase (GH16 family)|nr:glycoside hydrolase family 16 protein [Bacteroidales bacterium]